MGTGRVVGVHHVVTLPVPFPFTGPPLSLLHSTPCCCCCSCCFSVCVLRRCVCVAINFFTSIFSPALGFLLPLSLPCSLFLSLSRPWSVPAPPSFSNSTRFCRYRDHRFFLSDHGCTAASASFTPSTPCSSVFSSLLVDCWGVLNSFFPSLVRSAFDAR